jgi:uncharacterized membrane protein (Fun14 family)
MSKRYVQHLGKIGHLKDKKAENRSPFSATSVLLAGSLFVAALGVSTVKSGNSAETSWLQSLVPGTLTITGSYLVGFFIGWGARRAIKTTSIFTGLAIAATGTMMWLGWDSSAVQSWLYSTSAWAGENIQGAGRYLVSLLPSATAAAIGGVLGFKRK